MPSYNRLHLDGTISGGERWSCGIAFQDTDGVGKSTPSDLAAWAAAAHDEWQTAASWVTALKALWSVSVSLTQVRVYFYPETSGDAGALGVSTDTPVVGAGSVTFPFQSSLVFTLNTNTPGRSYRGRTYWPFLTGTMSSSGQSGSSTDSGNRADAFVGMLQAMAGAAPGPTGSRPVIVSAAKDAVTPVTSVRVGNVVDTQRRRRDSVIETFAIRPYA